MASQQLTSRTWRNGCLALLLFLLAACDRGPPAALSQVPACPGATPLTAPEIQTILAQAFARAAADGQAFAITVTNREGIVVGSIAMPGAPAGIEAAATQKARTAAFLSSNQHAFTTRTAFFIIQDHFPPNLPNVPGGPLYGVQFSSLPCSDIVGESVATPFDQEGSGLSGDTGSMPLYKDGCLVGGVGVEGATEPDDALEERAAWSAALGFRPSPAIYGSTIHVDGIRLDFIEEMPPDDLVVPSYADVLLAGAAELVAPVAAPPDQVFPTALFGGLSCEIRFAPADSARPVPATERLLAADVTAILDAAAARSGLTRAGIRRPLGTAMRCFVSVTDIDGTVLGSIRTPDATLFSFDVSIQKARAAAFFSTDTFAVTTRALGFLAQAFFPPGIDAAPEGPLHQLQDALSLPLAGPCVPPTVPELPNGITIFPGGIALYKGGVLAGAIGVSGDGVDQDDFIASAGADLFPPPAGARCDEADEASAVAALTAKVAAIGADATLAGDAGTVAAAADSAARLANGLQGIRLPYVKFPRQPYR
ncbi:MAG TPA: heme-binding protein [Planctomycetota bacterium]|nr:heme-binding protein [Planctomycetota bacterium]